MATKYDVLKALVEQDGVHGQFLHASIDYPTDYLVVAEVVGIISRSHESEEALSDAIFDAIADYYAGAEEEDSGKNPSDQA